MTNAEWLTEKMKHAGDFESAHDFSNAMVDSAPQDLVDWLAMDGSMEWFFMAMDGFNGFEKLALLEQIHIAQLLTLKREWEYRK